MNPKTYVEEVVERLNEGVNRQHHAYTLMRCRESNHVVFVHSWNGVPKNIYLITEGKLLRRSVQAEEAWLDSVNPDWRVLYPTQAILNALNGEFQFVFPR
jgi:hypothetical protein